MSEGAEEEDAGPAAEVGALGAGVWVWAGVRRCQGTVSGGWGGGCSGQRLVHCTAPVLPVYCSRACARRVCRGSGGAEQGTASCFCQHAPAPAYTSVRCLASTLPAAGRTCGWVWWGEQRAGGQQRRGQQQQRQQQQLFRLRQQRRLGCALPATGCRCRCRWLPASVCGLLLPLAAQGSVAWHLRWGGLHLCPQPALPASCASPHPTTPPSTHRPPSLHACLPQMLGMT